MTNVSKQLLSGALSGLATTVCLQPCKRFRITVFARNIQWSVAPVDLIKTRVQQGDGKIQKKQRVSLTFSTVRGVVAANGWRGLWRGTEASLVRNVPGVAFYMTGLTQLRTWMATTPYFALVRKSSLSDNANASVLPKLTSTGNLLAGATTRVGVGLLLNPFSVLKARYESDIYAYKSLSGAFLSIVRQGHRELLRGFLASSLRDAPYAGLFVVFYEGIKREASYLIPSTTSLHSAVIHGASAASAGAIATMVTQPFDVIKTKIQVRQEDRYRGFLKTVFTIWQQRGLSGYFDGASLRMSRKVFSSAIGWAVYEGILMFARTSNHRNEHQPHI